MEAKAFYRHLRDEELALAVHASENGAFECLVERYQDALFRFALRLLRDEFDAEEVVQDTVFRAQRALRSRYDESKVRSLILRPWLFRITRNLVLNRYRARRRHEVATDDDLSRLAEPRPAAEDSGRPELLQVALAGLDVHDRELLDLRFFQELRYSEMAEVVGGTEAAVRGRVFRALRKLRVRLENMGYSQCNAKM